MLMQTSGIVRSIVALTSGHGSFSTPPLKTAAMSKETWAPRHRHPKQTSTLDTLCDGAGGAASTRSTCSADAVGLTYLNCKNRCV